MELGLSTCIRTECKTHSKCSLQLPRMEPRAAAQHCHVVGFIWWQKAALPAVRLWLTLLKKKVLITHPCLCFSASHTNTLPQIIHECDLMELQSQLKGPVLSNWKPTRYSSPLSHNITNFNCLWSRNYYFQIFL